LDFSFYLCARLKKNDTFISIMERQLLAKLLLLISALVGGGSSVWADEIRTIWSEDWSRDDYSWSSNSATGPSVSTDGKVTYAYTGNTKVWKDNANAGGTVPELLIEKGSKTFTATITDFQGCGKTLTLTYYTNKPDKLNITSSDAKSISTVASTGTAKQYTRTIVLKDDATQLALVFTNSNGSSGDNIRLDNIELKGTFVDETTVSAPTFLLAEGTYYGTQSVMITTLTDDANIYYTLDGSTPTSASTLYTGVISVSSSKTIKAIAVKAGMNNSTVETSTYTIIPSIPAVNAKDYSNGYFVKVTDVDDLEDGDAILIVSKDGSYVMGGQSSKYRAAFAVSSADGVISSLPGNAQKIVLVKTENRFFLSTTTTNFLYASSSSSNNIGTDTESTAKANAMATIDIDASGDATIVFKGSNTNNSLRYNYNSGSPRFTCYSSGQEAVHIYKEVPGIAISAYGWGTLVCNAPLDFTGTGVNAYIVTGRSGTSVVMSDALTTVPANTPLLVNADEGKYMIPVAVTSTTDVSANQLKAGSGEAVSKAEGYDRYVLSVTNGKAAFKKINATAATVVKGRAYLEFDTSSAAPEFLSVDFGETTPVNGIDAAKTVDLGGVYNLNGQRVAHFSKGLYIMNRKKVIVK